MTNEEATELATSHWEWLEPLLKPHYSEEVMATMKYLFTTSMVHGIKHEREMHYER